MILLASNNSSSSCRHGIAPKVLVELLEPLGLKNRCGKQSATLDVTLHLVTHHLAPTITLRAVGLFNAT